MKVLIILGFLCILQVIAGQVTKDGDKVQQHSTGGQVNQPGSQVPAQASGQQDNQSNQNTKNKKDQQVAAQNVVQQHVVPPQVVQQQVVPQQVGQQQGVQQQVGQQHGGQQHGGQQHGGQQHSGQQHVGQQQVVQQHVKPQHSSENSKVSVGVPPKVQQVVTQVSQHIPQVVGQHVANKQRMMRSVNWQANQVNPIEQEGKCEFICNKEDVSVCGYNGVCYWEFESQCDLSTYNCLNTQKIFDVVDFIKCKESGAPKCYRGDM